MCFEWLIRKSLLDWFQLLVYSLLPKHYICEVFHHLRYGSCCCSFPFMFSGFGLIGLLWVTLTGSWIYSGVRVRFRTLNCDVQVWGLVFSFPGFLSLSMSVPVIALILELVLVDHFEIAVRSLRWYRYD
jgi:hypothetical protein